MSPAQPQRETADPLRIVLLNANTTDALTARMLAEANRFRRSDSVIYVGVTAPFGAGYISDRAAADTAKLAVGVVADDLEKTGNADAMVLACFGDPGLADAKSKMSVPVVGMAEASCMTACQVGERFSIVTGGHAWGPMLEDFVASIGLSARLASVRTLDLTGDQISKKPEAARDLILEQINLAIETDGANVVVLGGAGLVGLAQSLQERVRVPLLDSLQCALVQAEALISVCRSQMSQNP